MRVRAQISSRHDRSRRQRIVFEIYSILEHRLIFLIQLILPAYLELYHEITGIKIKEFFLPFKEYNDIDLTLLDRVVAEQS